MHNKMRQPLTGENVWRGCMNTSFEDSLILQYSVIQLSAEYWTAVAGLFAIAVVFCTVTDSMYAF